MKLLYHGHLWDGSTARQRFEAFWRQPGIVAVANDVGAELGERLSVIERLRWKLRWPVDGRRENERLLAAAAVERPDVVFVDNSRVISSETLRCIRDLCDPVLVFYSPDDIVAAHNSSWPLRWTFPLWDLFFTTKTFNIAELRARGVRNPALIGNGFDADVHRPMSRAEVGEDFERFDVVFVGTVEEDRFRSLAKLADAGRTVVVYGNPAGRWGRSWSELNSARVRVGSAAYAKDYAKLMHHGKVASCFLRKMNRDRITTRSIEIPAMGRPMVAEKTDEHDAHFLDGVEYSGFRSDAELLDRVGRLLADDALRSRLAASGRARCFESGYSTDDRAREMLEAIEIATAVPRERL